MYAEALKHLVTGTGSSSIPLLVMFGMFTPADSFDRHVAESRIGTVLELSARLRELDDGPFHDTLCQALRQELAEICLDSDGHPFCIDRAMIIDEAGC